ncbi:MOSC domain-containing protein [Rothia sp. LK2588]|uniref:MOSC domain-containing protein n=1 Tax=Rothia sp. LK2588 TaxID=3114369 RepID=UPI0034CDB456
MDQQSAGSTPTTHQQAAARVLSTNVAAPFTCPADAQRQTGIDKRPQPEISVFAPGPHYGDGSGVRGDFVGDLLHHSGAHKAVYAFANEELRYWSDQNGETYVPGAFGENLTTVGMDWTQAVINQRIRVGSALLEVSVPRSPCRTFAEWLEIKGWVKKFAAHGDCGSYFRVIEPGVIHPGDALEFLAPPEHGVTMGQAFRAAMGDRNAMRTLVEAACYPPFYHDRLVRTLEKSK